MAAAVHTSNTSHVVPRKCATHLIRPKSDFGSGNGRYTYAAKTLAGDDDTCNLWHAESVGDRSIIVLGWRDLRNLSYEYLLSRSL